jgi:hypothetical protein
MELATLIASLAEKAKTHPEIMGNEQATKTALIFPLLQGLGYDVFNPLEVVPEFTSDVGIKKGEKVDLAVKISGKVIMLIECKHATLELKFEHASQLFRYFTPSDAKFAILTNGIKYQFYTDLDKPNVMDSAPFFELDVYDFNGNSIEQLTKFKKDKFDLENILSTAKNLKHLTQLQVLIDQEFQKPSDEFLKFFISKIHHGNITQAVKEHFTSLLKAAFQEYISNKVKNRLKTALDSQANAPVVIEQLKEEPKIVSTQEEIEAYNIVKAILWQSVDVKRIVSRDTQSYFGILLDDNNRKPICRMHFNFAQKYIGLFKDKIEEKIAIADLSEIYKFADRLQETVAEYDNAKAA